MSAFEINRAPVLTLWAAVVAERLGYDKDTALSLGKAVAGLTAQRKGQRLGIYQKKEHAAEPEPAGDVEWVELVGRQVPTSATEDGVRAVIRGQAQTPESGRKYLESKFKDHLGSARKAMEQAGFKVLQHLTLASLGLNKGSSPATDQHLRLVASKGAQLLA